MELIVAVLTIGDHSGKDPIPVHTSNVDMFKVDPIYKQ